MTDINFIIISQSEMINAKEYASLPIERISIFKKLVYPRMIYYEGGFRSHLDILNKLKSGLFLYQADDSCRETLYSIWNLPGFSGIHIAAYLHQFGLSTYVINNIDTQWQAFCEVYAACSTPPLVGLSTTFYLSYSPIKRIVKKMRKTFPDLEIVLGGALVSSQTKLEQVNILKTIIKKNNINYTLTGFNSEEDLKQLLLSRNTQHPPLSEVPNLIYSTNNGSDLDIVQTESIWHQPNLTHAQPHKLDLPFINSTIQLRTSSGCPFCCAFCSYPETARGFHIMPDEEVEKQIQSILKIPTIKNIIFIDDTLNVPRKRFHNLCRLLEPHNIAWFSFLRVQYIDDETALMMKKSGCQAVYLGIESANNSILKNMQKKSTKEKYLSGIATLKKYGITTMAAFVIGFPGETTATIEENITFIESSGLDFYTLKEFFYMENTPIHEERSKYSLSGIGDKWSHTTMNSEKANQIKIDMFLRITQSLFVDPDTSVWYLAYLFDQGYSMKKIVEIQKHFNCIMKDQLTIGINDQHHSFNRLSAITHQRGIN